jgi:isopenicillin N synthase-like dioxygenase
VVEQFKAACTNTGFFYVKNHGVPQAVIDAVFDATRRYMSLPMEERLKDKHRRALPARLHAHGRHAASGPQARPEGKLRARHGPAADRPRRGGGLPLHGPNRWPADKPWLEPAAMAYFDATIALGRNLLKIFAAAVGKDEGFFLQYATKPMVQSRLFHYPPQESFTNLELGAAAHTDYGMLTLLAQDPIGGLELCTRGGEWVAAPYVEGTLVVNLGDLVKVWTNDVYVSNPHRVANRTGRERYSIPTFFNLDYDTPVACLPEFAPSEGAPRHAPIKSGDYLVRRFAAVQKYKTPAELAAG